MNIFRYLISITALLCISTASLGAPKKLKTKNKPSSVVKTDSKKKISAVSTTSKPSKDSKETKPKETPPKSRVGRVILFDGEKSLDNSSSAIIFENQFIITSLQTILPMLNQQKKLSAKFFYENYWYPLTIDRIDVVNNLSVLKSQETFEATFVEKEFSYKHLTINEPLKVLGFGSDNFVMYHQALFLGSAQMNGTLRTDYFMQTNSFSALLGSPVFRQNGSLVGLLVGTDEKDRAKFAINPDIMKLIHEPKIELADQIAKIQSNWTGPFFAGLDPKISCKPKTTELSRSLSKKVDSLSWQNCSYRYPVKVGDSNLVLNGFRTDKIEVSTLSPDNSKFQLRSFIVDDLTWQSLQIFENKINKKNLFHDKICDHQVIQDKWNKTQLVNYCFVRIKAFPDLYNMKIRFVSLSDRTKFHIILGELSGVNADTIQRYIKYNTGVETRALANIKEPSK